MDEEAKKALDEVFHILHTPTDGKQLQPAPTVSSETPPMQQPEEEPAVISPYTHKEPTALDLKTGKANKKSKRNSTERHWIRYAELAVALIILTVISVLMIIPLFEPTATITIIPKVATITTTSTIQVQGRTLAPLTLTQARTDQTTGIGHQDATAAHGPVTFYNALPQPQSIPTGELLTGSDGVQVITDQTAYLPAGTLATNGQASISAHAIVVGPQGNIKGGDIYGACCRMNVFVANGPFTGGQTARTFPMVTQSDLDTAIKQLHTSLEPGMTASLEAELHQGETDTPPACSTTATSDHKAGEEASTISTTLTARCLAFAYQTQDVQTQARTRLTRTAEQHLGDGYILTNDPVITVEKSHMQGTVLTLVVKGQAQIAYQFQEQLQRIKAHIAGMKKAEATAWLAHLPGVSSVSVDITGGTDNTTLPRDPNAIHCTLLYTGQQQP